MAYKMSQKIFSQIFMKISIYYIFLNKCFSHLFKNSKCCWYSFFPWHERSDWKIYIMVSLSVLSSITFISPLASSSSEREMNGFTASILSTKIGTWEFSFCLLASQGCHFKQWIKPSSLPLFARFKLQNLHGFMFSLDSWDQASSTHSIIIFPEGRA